MCWGGYFDPSNRRNTLTYLISQTTQPQFWENQPLAELTLHEIHQQEWWIKQYEDLVLALEDWREWETLSIDNPEYQTIATEKGSELNAAIAEMERIVNYSQSGDEWKAGLQIQRISKQVSEFPFPALLNWSKLGLTEEWIFLADTEMAVEVSGEFAFGKVRQRITQLFGQPEARGLLEGDWKIEYFPIPKWQIPPVDQRKIEVDAYREIKYSFARKPGGVRWRHVDSGIQVSVRSWEGSNWCNQKAAEWMAAKLAWMGVNR